MGITISILPVMEPDSARCDFLQQSDHVQGDTGIPVLLDHNSRGGAMSIDRKQALFNSAIPDYRRYLAGNIQQLFPISSS